MPPWGRPPGARGSRRRQQWEWEWGPEPGPDRDWDGARVAELESDEGDARRGGLPPVGPSQAYRDPFHRGGGHVSVAARARRRHAFADSEESDDSERSAGGMSAAQMALRDKEEALVQSALARIRRAQEKGKREVKLNQDELDALENRRKRMQAAAMAKARTERGSSGSDKEKKRRSDRISVPIAVASGGGPFSRPSSRLGSAKDKGRSRRSEDVQIVNPPGIIVPDSDGHLAYAPFGTYAQQPSARSSPPRTRPRSATAQRLRGGSSAAPHFVPGRHFSDSTRPLSTSTSSSRRPLPDDTDWRPSYSRRSSVGSSHSQSPGFGVDPFGYQVFADHPPPMPHPYLQGRRNVSGPADVSYSSVRRTLPAYDRAPASDPSLRSYEHASHDDDDDNDDDDESDHDSGNEGVQVVVEELERGSAREKAVVRKPVARPKKKSKR